MWSRKPTPVLRAPRARRRPGPASGARRSPCVARSISAVRRHRAAGILPHARLHRRRVRARTPRRARSARRRVRARPPRRRSAPRPCAGGSARGDRPRRSGRRRRWAASGSSRRRSRRRPSRSSPPDEHAAGARARAARAPRRRPPDELEVLGREGLGEGQRALGVRASARAPPRRPSPSQPASTPRATSSSSARSSRGGGDDRPRPVLGLRQRGRARPARRGARGRRRPARRWGREAVDADVARDQALGLLHLERRPGRRSTSTRGTLSVP